MTAFLLPAELVLEWLGESADHGSDRYWQVEAAVEMATALIRSYTRQTLSRVDLDLAMLRGTTDRVLRLGERPVVVVVSVVLDGDVLPTSDYRWSRSGSMFRAAGWGGPEFDIEIIYSHGFATVPDDVMAVTKTCAARLLSNPEQYERLRVEDFEVTPSRFPAALSLGEQRVLSRYRVGTFPR